jgi:hypothetical protein
MGGREVAPMWSARSGEGGILATLLFSVLYQVLESFTGNLFHLVLTELDPELIPSCGPCFVL